MPITVNGTGFKKGRAALRAEKGMLVISVTDHAPGGPTVRVVIPHKELLAAVARVHALTHAPDSVEELREIDEVAKEFGLQPVEPDEWDTVKAEIREAPQG